MDHGQCKGAVHELRDVLPEHLEQIWALNEAAVPAVSSVPVSFFEHYASVGEQQPMKTPCFRVALDKENGRVVGFLLALYPGEPYDSTNYRWFLDRYDDFLYVDRIVIAPEGQGVGLGTRFYQDLVRLAQDSRPVCARIACEVNLRPRNEQSLKFHERFGFQKKGSQEAEGGKKLVRFLVYRVSADE